MLTSLLIFLAAATALASYTQHFDAKWTVAGIAATGDEEGNPAITFWAGKKPSYKQLVAYNLAVIGITAAVGFVFPASPLAVGLACGVQFFNGILGHIKGMNEWKWFIAHPDQDQLPGKNFFQKFGLWFLFHSK